MKLAKVLENAYRNIKPLHLTSEEEDHFREALKCHICQKSFTDKDIKVRDHCHLTGIYRGPSHVSCNLSYNNAYHIPIVFHNLSGYNSHLLIREIGASKHIPECLTIIPQNKERFILFSKYSEGTPFNFRFIDSFRFMPQSLDICLGLNSPKMATLLSRFDF